MLPNVPDSPISSAGQGGGTGGTEPVLSAGLYSTRLISLCVDASLLSIHNLTVLYSSVYTSVRMYR